ncbi:peptide ABC transporter permease [Metallosphaera tengchongensis]|uniref:Peptide ABC transporter permease n=1 Tax=Metallosphaera tengchongensis TaxID=1532350 RepID=A0A6N0NTG2_9CREN|nr:peptide ABC transporter permease [Metallosphaera tengchongensis]QKQ99128.1 peptide ABC transporter permease [Metallosphaera tengchongensis]
MRKTVLALSVYLAWALIFSLYHLPSGKPLLPPSISHPLGTYVNGLDMINVNARAVVDTLLFGLLVSSVEVAIGITYGALAGNLCGTVRSVMMRVADGVNSLPRVPLLMAIILLFATPEITFVKANFFLTAIVVALTGWPVISRQASEILCKQNPISGVDVIPLMDKLKSSYGYVLPIIKRYSIISVIDGVAVYTALGVIAGVGDPNYPTLTTLLNSSRLFAYWWLFLPPAAFRALFLVLLFLVSDYVVK